jgi:flagellar protein FliO/FliZ
VSTVGFRLAALFFLAAASAPFALAAEKAGAEPAAGDVIYPRTASARAAVTAEHGSGYNAVLVVGLLMAGAGGWLFWRGRTAPGGVAALRRLAIAETKSLGNRQYLVVATYEDKKFLLGVCPGRIDLLTPLEGEKSRT